MTRKKTRGQIHTPISTGRRAFRWAFAGAVLAGLAYGVHDLYKFCVRTDLFMVEEVQILGTELLTQAEVFREMDAPTKVRLWQIQPERIQANLLRHNLIEAVHVKRVLPQTLVVEVLERKPVALWEDPNSGNRYVLDEKRWLLCTLGEFRERLDRNGIDRRTLGPMPLVVFNDGVRGSVPGDRLDVEGLDDLLNAYDILLSRGERWIASIERFERLDSTNGWIVRCRSRVDEIRLGRENLTRRIGKVDPVWKFLEREDVAVEYVDLRFELQGVVIKPRNLGVHEWMELNGFKPDAEKIVG